MNKDTIIALAKKYLEESPANYIAAENALHPSYVGLKIYENPIFAFGATDDELYLKYKSSAIIGSHFMSPLEWLPSAKTVIAFFLPYTAEIRKANALDFDWPAEEWLHGRYEGNFFLRKLTKYLVACLVEANFATIAPAIDKRLEIGNALLGTEFTSNWSERHIAYASGLGTFGLSKGIITAKGTCGRLGSLVTELDLPKDSRAYTNAYEYCTKCGICIDNCPARAISATEGKKDQPCADFLDTVLEKHQPRYACGKCQIKVPCENVIPQ